jgi:SagB-type dehydrogenase family enzyme
MTQRDGQRTAPSAGALYPLELYCIVGDNAGLDPGVYQYRPALHALVLHLSGDRRVELADIALDQSWIAVAPLVLAIAADFERTTRKYGERGVRYVHIEVGHAAQNACLMATSLGLGSATVGAFDDDDVKTVLQLPQNEVPLYLLSVGRH